MLMNNEAWKPDGFEDRHPAWISIWALQLCQSMAIFIPFVIEPRVPEPARACGRGVARDRDSGFPRGPRTRAGLPRFRQREPDQVSGNSRGRKTWSGSATNLEREFQFWIPRPWYRVPKLVKQSLHRGPGQGPSGRFREVEAVGPVNPDFSQLGKLVPPEPSRESRDRDPKPDQDSRSHSGCSRSASASSEAPNLSSTGRSFSRESSPRIVVSISA